MIKKQIFVIACIFSLFLLQAQVENKKIHAFLMIDKSLSMKENNSFSFLQNWLNNDFLPSIAKENNSISVFLFYGETKKVFQKTIKDEFDLQELQNIIRQTKADGSFTDIGLAMDTLKEAIQNAESDSMPIALIFTDLIQEASYTSKYAGTYYDFAQRYLTDDRVIALKPDCFQVTIQLEKANTIEKRANTIYTAIKDSIEEPLYRQ